MKIPMQMPQTLMKAPCVSVGSEMFDNKVSNYVPRCPLLVTATGIECERKNTDVVVPRSGKVERELTYSEHDFVIVVVSDGGWW